MRWFDEIQGVGVADAGPGHDLRVSHRDLPVGAYRALDPGDRITCRVEASARGPVARDVRLERSLPRA